MERRAARLDDEDLRTRTWHERISSLRGELDIAERELSLLHALARAAASGLAPSEVCAQACREVATLTGFPLAVIEQYDPGAGTVRRLASTGPADALYVGEAPLSQALAALPLRTGQTLIETRVREDPDYAEAAMRRLGLYTYLGTPIRAAGRIVGAVSLGSFDPAEPPPRVIRLVEALAGALGPYVWAPEGTTARAADARQNALGRLASRLAGCASLDSMVVVIREETDRLFAWDAHFFAVRRPEEPDVLRVLSFVDTVDGQKREFPGEPWRTAEVSPTLRPVLEGRGVLINRLPGRTEPPLDPFGDREHRSTSLMYVPVRAGHSVVALLSVQSYTHGRYDEADLEFLQHVADAVAPAIERAYTEQALRKSEGLLRAIFEATPDLITLHDRDYNVVLSNWHGHSYVAAEVRRSSSKCYQAYFQRSEPCDDCYMREVFETGASVRLERRNAIDGRLREIRCYPVFGEDGRVALAVVIVRDITDQRTAEEQLRHAQKMQAVGSLAAGVAHDFGNLLQAIGGCASTLRKHLPADEKVRECVQIIEEAVQQGRSVTEDLVTLSRRRSRESVPFDLTAAVSATIRLLRHSFPSNIELIDETASETGIWIRGDENQMRQVIVNLAVNARDAMPHGGRLRIGVTAYPRGAVTPRGAMIVVEDTGCGMPEEVRSRVFEPFFTTKPRGRGSGLGMAVVRQIVGEHGGGIEIESGPGRGTRVMIRLPCLRPPAIQSAPPERRVAAFVLEPNEQVRRVLSSGLRSAGHAVVAAEDLDQVRRGADQAPADLPRALIFDADRLAGQADEIIRVAADLRMRLVAIVSTPPGEPPEARPGCDRVVSKPFTLAELGAIVGTLGKHDPGG